MMLLNCGKIHVDDTGAIKIHCSYYNVALFFTCWMSAANALSFCGTCGYGPLPDQPCIPYPCSTPPETAVTPSETTNPPMTSDGPSGYGLPPDPQCIPSCPAPQKPAETAAPPSVDPATGTYNSQMNRRKCADLIATFTQLDKVRAAVLQFLVCGNTDNNNMHRPSDS